MSYVLAGAGKLLGYAKYAPAANTSKTVAGDSAAHALDTTNLRVTFNAPASGEVIVALRAKFGDRTANGKGWGVMNGAAVVAMKGNQHWSNTEGGAESDETSSADAGGGAEVEFLVVGLTPGASYSFDWAGYGSVGTPGIKAGIPASNPWGIATMEVWEVTE